MQSSLSMKVAMFKIPFNQGKLLGNVPWLIQSVLAYSCSTETFLYTTFHLFRWANKLSSQRFWQDCLNKCSLLVWGLPSIYLKYVIPFWCLFHFYEHRNEFQESLLFFFNEMRFHLIFISSWHWLFKTSLSSIPCLFAGEF